MYIQFVSLGARAIKRLFEPVIAFLAQAVNSKHAIIRITPRIAGAIRPSGAEQGAYGKGQLAWKLFWDK